MVLIMYFQLQYCFKICEIKMDLKLMYVNDMIKLRMEKKVWLAEDYFKKMFHSKCFT